MSTSTKRKRLLDAYGIRGEEYLRLKGLTDMRIAYHMTFLPTRKPEDPEKGSLLRSIAAV